MTAGVILLVPQRIVSVVMSLVDTDVRSWFPALYHPQRLQLATGALLAILGAVALGLAWRLRPGPTQRESSAEP